MLGNQKDMFEKKNWVVIGVTNKKHRFGYRIWALLQELGYNVYGINPNIKEIDGIKIYGDLREIEDTIDVINMVVNPEIGKNHLEVGQELGIEDVFFQPGSFNQEIIDLADRLGYRRVTGCVYASLS